MNVELKIETMTMEVKELVEWTTTTAPATYASDDEVHEFAERWAAQFAKLSTEEQVTALALLDQSGLLAG